jgi:hypothetical protein
MNTFYVTKVDKLREKIADAPPPPLSDWPKKSAPFNFSYANAGRIAKIVRGLGSTEALGIDGIPISVLKKGIETLASLLAHLINRSLASGTVPRGFKEGIVHPVFKGSGKCWADLASYRPVSILSAMSKVLEVVVKEDLELHLSQNNGLPTTQYGFRKGRSCTTALASAHARWTEGLKAGQVVGVAAFDLTAAFDTVDKAQLVPKLTALGITGKARSWFESYLSGGQQCVDWNGARSGHIFIEFGVRQGSILGPLLYRIHVADMRDCVGIGSTCNSRYADDTAIWAVGTL